MTRLYTAEETTAIRQKVINNYALPIVEKAFNKYPKIRSASFAVAQYWNDGASDEVHCFILHSVLEKPNWEAYDLYNEDPENCENYSDDDWDNYFDNAVKDPVNLPGITEHQDVLGGNGDIFGSQLEEFKGDTSLYHFEGLWSNFIAAFAAFCQEDAHQDMDYAEAYTPYALFTRTNEGIKVDIVGKMLRPWLDGIRPEDDY